MSYIKELKICGFRNHDSIVLSFEKGTNIIIGKNASGKTSICEAISCICIGKSFKTRHDNDLINSKLSNFYVCAEVVDRNCSEIIEISRNTEKKIVSINNKKIHSLSLLIGKHNNVVFSPDDLEIIKGEPKSRRSFLDYSLCQFDKRYYEALVFFKKLIKDKSSYLSKTDLNEIDMNFLKILNERIAEVAKTIVKSRQEFVLKLESFAQMILTSINKEEKLELKYMPNVCENDLKIVANQKLMDDINAKTTTWGPLRDDLLILLNENKANNFASQGQQRSIVVALKLAVLEMFKQAGKDCFIILDDVLSELDKERQNNLFKYISSVNQAFITTTDISLLNDEYIKESNIIRL